MAIGIDPVVTLIPLGDSVDPIHGVGVLYTLILSHQIKKTPDGLPAASLLLHAPHVEGTDQSQAQNTEEGQTNVQDSVKLIVAQLSGLWRSIRPPSFH